METVPHKDRELARELRRHKRRVSQQTEAQKPKVQENLLPLLTTQCGSSLPAGWRSHLEEFATVKNFYPQYVCAGSKLGEFLVFERVGYVSWEKAKRAGMTSESLMYYTLFRLDFLRRTFLQSNPGKEFSVTFVVDMKDVSMETEYQATLSRFSQTNEGSLATVGVRRVFVVNTPTWLSLAWTLFSPFHSSLNPQILSEDLSQLTQEIGEQNLPRFLGGQISSHALSSTPEEEQFRECLIYLSPISSPQCGLERNNSKVHFAPDPLVLS